MFDDPVIVNTAFHTLNILSANWPLLKLCNSIKLNVWYLQCLEKLAIKMWFPINFLKTLKDCYFVADESRNLKFSSIISTIIHSYMSNFQKKLTFAEIFDWLKVENVSCFYFWNKRRQKEQNFHFPWPYGYDFWRVFGDLVGASNKYNFGIFFKM